MKSQLAPVPRISGLPTKAGDFAILTKRTQFEVYPRLQTGNGDRPTAMLTERTQFQVYPRLQTGNGNRQLPFRRNEPNFRSIPASKPYNWRKLPWESFASPASVYREPLWPLEAETLK